MCLIKRTTMNTPALVLNVRKPARSWVEFSVEFTDGMSCHMTTNKITVALIFFTHETKYEFGNNKQLVKSKRILYTEKHVLKNWYPNWQNKISNTYQSRYEVEKIRRMKYSSFAWIINRLSSFCNFSQVNKYAKHWLQRKLLPKQLPRPGIEPGTFRSSV